MCGITGIAMLSGESPAQSVVDRMNDTLWHRGPDGFGSCIQDGVALAMRRLAVIDIEGGWQPIYNENGSVALVFNGEIYNFRELRRELEKAGHRFRTRSDSEVIVHAYEEFGLDFPKHLKGMFALAIHDRKEQRLILARDHFGIKPLYFAVGDRWLAWGSEPKALLASNLFEPTLDLDALAEFFDWEYVPAPRTLFKQIRKLPPAHLLVCDLKDTQAEPKLRRYWDLSGSDTESPGIPETEWTERIDAVLSDSVRAQLVSDVPLGAFLSGGVDSSLIVSSMGDALTFSIGFDDPSYNELAYSREVASHLGVRHTTKTIDPEVGDLFSRLMHYMDDPIGDFSIFPTFLVSELAREQVTVALSGDGGDELFGGYETYLAQKFGRRMDWLPPSFRSFLAGISRSIKPTRLKKGSINKIKRFCEGLEFDPALQHARWRLFCGAAMRSQLFSPEVLGELSLPSGAHIRDLFGHTSGRPLLDQQLYVDTFSYLSDNCLVKTDRMSMAVSLETRVPFLDPDVATLAFSIPAHMKLQGRETKSILKATAAKHLPRHCVYRPKEGFSIPIKAWLKGELRPLLEDACSRTALDRHGLFRSDTISRLKTEHLSGKANHSHLLWSLIVFQDWYSRWLDGAIAETPKKVYG